jgi:phosphoribosylaminoimidazole carboxylase
MDNKVVGVLGGGQLGLMLSISALRIGQRIAVLDTEHAPAKQINVRAADLHVTGSFKNADDVRKLAANSDVITYEIEHVDTKILEELHNEQATVPGSPGWNRLQPSYDTVRIIQDKFVQKQHYARHDIPTARSIAVGTSEPQGLKEIADVLGYPLMLKSRTDAYDGRGNYPVKSVSDIEPALRALSNRPLYAEQWANFTMELAVMVVKISQEISTDYESCTLAYPTVETVHEESICKLVYAPARGVDRKTLLAAQVLARRAVATFLGTGVFGVELFLLPNGSLVVNEIAPRTHNSGHYTIDACGMSQFEAQIRAVLPHRASKIRARSLELKVPAAIMLNVLGGPEPDSHLLVADAADDIDNVAVHLYGKGDGRPGRKMGHLTVTGSSMSECERAIHPLIQLVDAIRAHRVGPSDAKSILSSSSALIKSNPAPNPSPVIAVVMGSDTDLATLKPGLQFLDEMEIPYLVTITSAHRTPQHMLDFGKAAASRGIKAIIAAAGGAAHLPGMMASVTSVPVIGCPVKASSLDGLDSLLSIVQMPRGVPVATVSIGNSTNAALLAARIVGTSDARIREWVEAHLERMDRENMAKAASLEEKGWKDYVRIESWDKK